MSFGCKDQEEGKKTSGQRVRQLVGLILGGSVGAATEYQVIHF